MMGTIILERDAEIKDIYAKLEECRKKKNLPKDCIDGAETYLRLSVSRIV